MIAEKLRKAVLQAAMEGKLTDRFPTDGFTSIKIDKPIKSITLDEIRFEIPNNWGWFRVGDLFDIRNGFTPLRSNKEFWNSKDIPWFTVNDIRNQGRIIYYTEQFISKSAATKNRIVPKNSILLCCTASIGEFALTKIELTTNQQFNSLTIKEHLKEHIEILYVYYWVQTIKEELINKAGKTTFPFLSVSKLSQVLIPIPPLSEQKRIVEKLDHMLAIIAELERYERQLKDFDDNFPESLKDSILKAAIQGKLTKQLSEDGHSLEFIQDIGKRYNKKIKILPEGPFDIPYNWIWTTLNDISESIRSGGTPSRYEPRYWQNGNIPWIKIKDIKGKYVDTCEEYITEEGLNNFSAKLFTKGTILYTIFATIGDCGILNIDASTNQAIAGITLLEGIALTEYIYYVLVYSKTYMMSKSRGMAQNNINLKILRSLPIPIPPISEQKRIVDLLNAIFKCEIFTNCRMIK